MKVAIVHEWLESYAGSERVLEQLIACWPDADIFAVCDFLPESQRHFLGGRPVHTSFIQRLPFARKRFRWYLGLMPIAVEQFDLASYDLVVSSHHAVAKGVITGPNQAHVGYVHSPMRYAWDMQAQYLRQAGMERGLRSIYTRWLLHRLRIWDRSSAAGVDTLVGNSHYIAQRIRKVWRREAEVVHPPVDVAGFPFQAEKGGDFVVVSRFVPYKRVDLVVSAFRGMPQHRLLVVGDGPEATAIRAAAGDAPNISLLGALPQAELVGLMQKARAFVFAAEEDFGIAMVEAQACGTPVIAFGRGGACDIVRTPDMPRPTGLLFPEQSVASIQAAVTAFTALSPGISPEDCRHNAQRFDRRNFRTAMLRVAQEALAKQGLTGAVPHRAGPFAAETAEAA
ncbi:MAG: glycosyltransferase family 4 protein [Rhodospirillales bacterium]|jgi:glycosyltransferase involved in cell wall biosynthesis|nr:glycosyltransferase family 4 protein [Rhodospirillales bacterium]